MFAHHIERIDIAAHLGHHRIGNGFHLVIEHPIAKGLRRIDIRRVACQARAQ
jgi:hypothetical protein